MYFLVSHILALLALLQPLRMPLSVQAGLIILVCASLLWRLYRFILTDPYQLIRDTNGEWRLQDVDGKEVCARLRPDSYVGMGICILRFRSETGRMRSFVMLPDMLDSETWRRLRIELRQTRADDARFTSSI